MDDATERLAGRFQSHLRPVINATGVIIHTNLGRAPLAAEALARVQAIGAGYVSIEHDLDAGRRGRRDRHAEPLLQDLTGAGAALIVNNNAAAVLLMLTALAQGREVLISARRAGGDRRRLPRAGRHAPVRRAAARSRHDQSHARCRLRRVHLRSHRAHPARPSLELRDRRLRRTSGSARPHGARAPVQHVPSSKTSAAATLGGVDGLDEPDVPGSLRDGVDVVTFSGDKLLGGPQAGIIAGRLDLVDTMRRHPLMRALRVDKLTYAALEGTLVELGARARCDGGARAAHALRACRRHRRARGGAGAAADRTAIEGLAASTSDAQGRTMRATTIDGWSAIGGGSAPGRGCRRGSLPSMWTMSRRMICCGACAKGRLPVIARIEDQRIVLDLRTVAPEQDEQLADLLLAALGASIR